MSETQSGGFKSMGEFCKAVMNAENGGAVDERLELKPDEVFEKDGTLWRTNNAERRFEQFEAIRYKCFDCCCEFVTAYVRPVKVCPFGCGGKHIERIDADA